MNFFTWNIIGRVTCKSHTDIWICFTFALLPPSEYHSNFLFSTNVPGKQHIIKEWENIHSNKPVKQLQSTCDLLSLVQSMCVKCFKNIKYNLKDTLQLSIITMVSNSVVSKLIIFLHFRKQI